MRSLRLKCCYWAQIFLILFMFSHTVSGRMALAEPAPPASGPAENQSVPSALMEYAKYLREEEKAHREYLERLYTITIAVLGVLVAVFGSFNIRTKADVKKAVDARFKKTVQVELDNAMEEFKRDMSARSAALLESQKRDLSDMMYALDANRVSKPEMSGTPGPDGEPTPAPDLDQRELAILNLAGSGPYSFRSLTGIANEARQPATDVTLQLENLSKKGLVGKTLGKTGGERWFVTAEGRKYLMAHSPTSKQPSPAGGSVQSAG
jgi:hypothetical protein